MTLSADDTELLTKLLGMLSSDHAGERATAGAMADKLLRKNKMTWADFFARPPCRREPEPRTTEDIINFCLGHQAALTEWETGFLQDVAKWVWRGLSEKQLAVVQRILRKVERYIDLTGQ